jgi:hypothetical protein
MVVPVGGDKGHSKEGSPEVSKPTIDVPVISMLRDRFRDLAEKFASPSLRGVVVEADGEPVSVSIVDDPRLPPTARAEFEILSREAAGRVGDQTKHPDGSTPEGRWILFVARSLSAEWPVRHGTWVESSKVDPGDEIFTNIDNLFLSSSVAIDLVLARQRPVPAADTKPTKKKTLDENDLLLAIAALFKEEIVEKKAIAKRLGVAPAFLSRGKGKEVYQKVRDAWVRRPGTIAPESPTRWIRTPKTSEHEAEELRRRHDDD